MARGVRAGQRGRNDGANGADAVAGVQRGAEIHAVSRGMAILEALADAPDGLTVFDLVDRLEIEKSIVSRILATLESSGHVHRDSISGAYRMTLSFIGMAMRRLDTSNLYDLCQPVLRRLAELSGELVQIALVSGKGLTYVAKAESNQQLRMLSLLGQRAPLHASTAGKVWLAGLPETEAIKLALEAGLFAFSPRTLTTVEELQAELSRVREHGYALVEDEFLPGANGVGVPILDQQDDGKVVGALMISGPGVRLTRARMEELLPELMKAANELTELGHLASRWCPSPGFEGDASREQQ